MSRPAAGILHRMLALDTEFLLWLRQLERPVVTRVMQAVTRLGDEASWVLVGLVLFATGGEGAVSGALLAVAALTATAGAQMLKRTCRRPRPNAALDRFVALTANPDCFSFPSGHTAAVAAVAVALLGQGLFLGPLFLALGVAVGASRVYLGAHYPLDVIAGAAVGVAAGILARLLIL